MKIMIKVILFLVEVPNKLIDYIMSKGELMVKGIENSILCTDYTSFELKYLETTNNYILLTDKKVEDYEENSTNLDPNQSLELKQSSKVINLITQHTLEINEYTPKKYTIYNLLKQNCALSYDFQTGEDNFNNFENKYTIEDLFSLSELCSRDFLKMIKDFSFFEKNGYICIFEEKFLYNYLYSLLLNLWKEKKDKVSNLTINEIFDSNLNQELIDVTHNLSLPEKKAMLQYIFDSDENEFFYSLNVDKIKLFCVKNIFINHKEDYFKIDDFNSILNSAFATQLPFEIYEQITNDSFKYTLTTSCDDNIFESYKEFDYRFLNGCCIIVFLNTQRSPLIRFVDISQLADDFDNRLTDLFKLKEKWTLNELKHYLDDLKIVNLEEKLTKHYRVITENNPFDTKRVVNYYAQKYKLY